MNAWVLPTSETTFDARVDVNNPWITPAVSSEPPKPDFADNEALKQAYGIELGRGLDTFKAGMEIFKNEMPKALWVSYNWPNDPIVMAARDAYKQTAQKLQKPLDKEELLARILAFHDEKDTNGRPLVEDKERLNALRLYSEVAGFTGKINIDASTNTTNNSNTNNFTKIVLVSGNKEEPKTIDQVSNTQSKIQNGNIPSIPLKLVGGVGR